MDFVTLSASTLYRGGGQEITIDVMPDSIIRWISDGWAHRPHDGYRFPHRSDVCITEHLDQMKKEDAHVQSYDDDCECENNYDD